MKVDAIGIDFSHARPSPADIKLNGATFVARYACQINNLTTAKIITPTEYAGYVKVGLDVMAIHEWYTGRAREGYNAGVDDGRIALEQWKACGHPQGCLVYFNDDSGRGWDSRIAQYVDGCNHGMNGYYHADFYGNGEILRNLHALKKIRVGWLPGASAWPEYTNAVNHPEIAGVHQNGKTWYNGQADENIVRVSFIGSRMDLLNKPPVAVPTAPPIEEIDGPMLILHPDEKEYAAAKRSWPGYFTYGGGRPHHITQSTTTVDNLANFHAAGLKFVPISMAQMDSLLAGR